MPVESGLQILERLDKEGMEMKSGKLSQEHREQRNFGVQIWKQNLKQLSFKWKVPTCFLEENGGTLPYPFTGTGANRVPVA